MVNWDLKWRRESMRQRATVKLFQMVGAAKKAALKTLVKSRPRERSRGREGMEILNPPNPVMTFGSEKKSQPKRRTSVTQQRPSCFSRAIKPQDVHYNGHSLSSVKLLAASPSPRESMNNIFLRGRIRKGHDQLSKYKQLWIMGKFKTQTYVQIQLCKLSLSGSESLFLRVAFSSGQTANWSVLLFLVLWQQNHIQLNCIQYLRVNVLQCVNCYKEKTIPRDNNCQVTKHLSNVYWL